jgi:hypothetical protein
MKEWRCSWNQNKYTKEKFSRARPLALETYTQRIYWIHVSCWPVPWCFTCRIKYRLEGRRYLVTFLNCFRSRFNGVSTRDLIESGWWPRIRIGNDSIEQLIARTNLTKTVFPFRRNFILGMWNVCFIVGIVHCTVNNAPYPHNDEVPSVIQLILSHARSTTQWWEQSGNKHLPPLCARQDAFWGVFVGNPPFNFWREKKVRFFASHTD